MTIRDDLRRWLVGAALPFWSNNGIDRAYGGYVESIGAGLVPNMGVKRVRVIGRQIYVFAHASLLGFTPDLTLAEHGYQFLIKHAWLPSSGGWARTLHRDGSVQDATLDLCDFAFVLFALGWYARASGDDEPLRWAHRTIDAMDEHLRHPSGEGFHHALGASGPRLQNPHMHLLEASLMLMEAAPEDARFRALADEVHALFVRRFYDPTSRTLAEYFTENLARAPGEHARRIEPGHQFEWAWILGQYHRLCGVDQGPFIRGLTGFAEEHGVDRGTGMTFDAVRDDGLPLDRGSRDWPNTERMKAAVALWELEGRDPWPVLEQSGRLLLDRYLDVKPAGTWVSALDKHSRPCADRIPASSFYHFFLAITETLRIDPPLPAMPRV